MEQADVKREDQCWGKRALKANSEWAAWLGLPEAVVPPMLVVVAVREELARQQAHASTHKPRHQWGGGIPARLLLVWLLAVGCRGRLRLRHRWRHTVGLGRRHHPGRDRWRRAREGRGSWCRSISWLSGGWRICHLAPLWWCLRRRRARGSSPSLLWIRSWARLRLLGPAPAGIQVGGQRGRGWSIGARGWQPTGSGSGGSSGHGDGREQGALVLSVTCME